MSENKPTSHITNFLRNIIRDDLSRQVNEPRYWRGLPGSYTQQMEGKLDNAKVRLRFPPEPNGYLHIGHAKSICLNFTLANDYEGRCHMRFDDTNPVNEDQEYVDSILDSVKWLGFSWDKNNESNFYFASDYFDYMYEVAEFLIKIGCAYVDEQSADDMRENRGTLHEPGKNSPYRDRTPEENLRIFREMKDGKHPEGSMVLRSKIDMASRNINLRDPAIYRIRFAEHHRTGNKWCIYPMYTFAHPLEDQLEMITHSICTLEFEDQKAFYNWAVERAVPVLRKPLFDQACAYLNELKDKDYPAQEAFLKTIVKFKWKIGQTQDETELAKILSACKENPELLPEKANEILAHITNKPELYTPLLQEVLSLTVKPNYFLLPHQYEFNRLNLTNVVMSKRKLIALVKEGLVDGWDDPRMPTLVGLRRRGYTPESIRLFCERIGVSKQTGGWIDYSVLEGCLREDLDARATRRIAIQDPIKLIIDNYPEDLVEEVEAPNHPQHPEMGSRKLKFSKELWIESADFSLNPPKGYRRMTLAQDGKEAMAVRLRHGYVVRATSVEKDENGKVTTVHAEYFPDTKSGSAGSNNIKVKAAIHWLSSVEALPAEIRSYGRLFTEAHPDAGEKDFRELINRDSKLVYQSYVEPALRDAFPEDRFQFERNGYYVADKKDFNADHLVFNLAVPLKDSFNK
ncbi:MAG: glutamine--tRNA ligase [Burkholderiaceae bacterium]|nr:glutamine--tRNA ligase [Burkholderiaceae bacterium]